MVKIIFSLIAIIWPLLTIKSVISCRLLVPSEYLSGCIFDRLNVMAPRTGTTINGQCCNRVVAKEEFIEQPYVYFQNSYEEKSYTVMMLDGDEPGSHAGQFYLNWLVTNVPGYALKQGLGVGHAIGDTLITYLGPDPQAFSGPHRYMFFVYEQTDRYFSLPKPVHRTRFNLMEWMRSFGGEDLLRGPVGSIGFLSEY